jgi:hypothetical protein
MDTKGAGGGFLIRTIQTLTQVTDMGTTPPTVTVTDTYPAGVSWTPAAKYQIHRGDWGLVWVPSQTPPYNTTMSSGSGFPLAFATMAEAQNAIQQTNFGPPEGYKFYGRNPRFEIAQAIDAYKQNTEEFLETDLALATGLTTRNTTAGNLIYNFVASKVVNQDSNNQYVLGLSAASGGGQNTTYLANSLSTQQLQGIAENAFKSAMEIPIVSPFESPIVAEAHAQAVEAKNAGEIRDQQIRQAIASAGGVYQGISKAEASGTHWSGWDGASILIGAYGQAGAARQT